MSDTSKTFINKDYLIKFWDEKVKKAPKEVEYKLKTPTTAEDWARGDVNNSLYAPTHKTLVGAINELGSITEINGIKVTKAVGGIAKGKAYPAGTSLVTILTEMLCPYYAPKLTVTTSPNPSELGVATTGTAVVTLTAGSMPVTSCNYSYKYMDGDEEKTASGTLTFANNSATLNNIPVSGAESQTYTNLFTINDGKDTVTADADFTAQAKVIAFFSTSTTMTATELASKISATADVYKGFESKALSSAQAKTKYAISVPMAANATDVYLYVATPTSTVAKVGDSMDTNKSMQAKQTLTNVTCNNATSNYNVYRASDTSNDDGSHAGTFYFWKDV